MCVCVCRPVAAAACHLWFPQARCGSKQAPWADRSWGLWLGGRGLQPGRTAALSKRLLTPATLIDCTILCSFFLLPPAGSDPGLRCVPGAPGRSSNIYNTIELFSSCMFFGGAAVINRLGGNHLSISGQKILHTLIRIISAKLREENRNFQEADGRTRSQQLCRPDGMETNCFDYLLNSIPSPVTDT